MTQISRQRSREILAAASALFNRQGIDSTSMAEIARAAGIGKSTIYEYFPSKAVLVQEMGLFMLRHYQERMEQVFSPDVSLHEQLCRYLEAMPAESGCHGEGGRALENFLQMLRLCDAERLQEEFMRMQSRAYSQMAQSIQSAMDRGELPEGTDPKTAARLMLALLNPMTMNQLKTAGLEDAAKQAVETILRGLQQ